MPIFFETPAKFRAWLRRNGGTERALVVGVHKRGSGRASMTWEESVDEALCCGWIDGVRKRLDEHAYTIRFSPRQPSSNWSAINIAKVKALRKQGRMTKAGLDAFARRDKAKSQSYSYEQVRGAAFTREQTALFRKNTKAWRWFEAQPPGYRRLMAWYLSSAKRPETRAARLARVIRSAGRGIRL